MALARIDLVLQRCNRRSIIRSRTLSFGVKGFQTPVQDGCRSVLKRLSLSSLTMQQGDQQWNQRSPIQSCHLHTVDSRVGEMDSQISRRRTVFGVENPGCEV